MKKICKECKENKEITNAHFQLCMKCNNNRLQANNDKNKPKEYNNTTFAKTTFKRAINKQKEPAKKSLFIKTYDKSKSTKTKINEDEAFYLECFNTSNHKCEECNTNLPDEFSDSNGKVIARWRYSHIVPKSIASELRHVVKNINHLCLKCHGEWENGNKVKMKIFEENYSRFPNYLNKLVSK